MNLLLVEDDRSIAGFLRRGIENAGHLLDWTIEGQEAIRIAGDFAYDAVILDLMLPDIDGLEVCTRLRHRHWNLPILILSARDQVPDRIAGLSAGADDFLVKPFSFDELLARLAAIQRRSAQGTVPGPVEGDVMRLDRAARVVSQNGRNVELTAREFQLLEVLLRNKNKVVPRVSILNQVWGVDADICDNSVDVYVGYLRKKLDLGGRLTTVRGVGFKLVAR